MSQDNEPGNPSRRAVAGGLFATILAAGSTSSCTPSGPPTTMSAPLHAARESGIVFTDAAGNVIDLNALQRRLNGNPSTLSFLFGQCADICPLTGIALGDVSSRYPNLHNVVISVQPQHDRLSLESFLNNGFLLNPEATGLRTANEQFGRRANTTVLYPALLDIVDGREVITLPEYPRTAVNGQDEEMARRIGILQQRYFNLPTSSIDPIVGHTGTVLVYDQQGELAGTIDHNSRIATELPGILNAMGQEEQRTR